MTKSEPDPNLVQRDAMRSFADDHHSSGSNLEAVLARISAQVTADAARKRATCQNCHKLHRIGCRDGLVSGSACPNKTLDRTI